MTENDDIVKRKQEDKDNGTGKECTREDGSERSGSDASAQSDVPGTGNHTGNEINPGDTFSAGDEIFSGNKNNTGNAFRAGDKNRAEPVS